MDSFIPVGLGMLVGMVLWIMYRRRPGAAAHLRSDGVQVVEVEVQGCYVPDSIVLRNDLPVELRFTRTDPSDCAARLLIPAFEVNRRLPLGASVTIRLPAPAPGEYLFTCEHGMYHGRLHVREGKDPRRHYEIGVSSSGR